MHWHNYGNQRTLGMIHVAKVRLFFQLAKEKRGQIAFFLYINHSFVCIFVEKREMSKVCDGSGKNVKKLLSYLKSCVIQQVSLHLQCRK